MLLIDDCFRIREVEASISACLLGSTRTHTACIHTHTSMWIMHINMRDASVIGSKFMRQIPSLVIEPATLVSLFN